MNHLEDLSDRSALLGELAIDRRVLALDASAQAQEFSMVAQTRSLKVRLPSAQVDQPFQLVVIVARSNQ